MRPALIVVAAALVATSACSMQNAPTAGSPTVLPTTTRAATPTARPSASTTSAATTTAPSGTVTYEATGSGKAITVDYTPDAKGAADRIEAVALPWKKQVPIVGSPTLFEVVIVGGDGVGCTITIGGKVVAQEPAGGSAHCVYQP